MEASLQPLAAFSILLESYLGSAEVGFFFKDSTHREKSICLDLSGNLTVDKLASNIGESLSCDPPNIVYDNLPLKALLWIGKEENDKEVGLIDTKTPLASFGDRFDLVIKVIVANTHDKTSVTSFLNPRVFGHGQDSRPAEQFMHILDQICNSDAKGHFTSNLTLAGKGDTRTILAWNSPLKSPTHGTVLRTFLRHVASRPQATSIYAWDGMLTYGELDHLSSRLAANLLAAGVGKGAIVPLFFEKTMWTPVAIIGVLKSGAGFSLMDEDLPKERMAQLLQLICPDCALSLASTTQHSRARHLTSKVILVNSNFFDTQIEVPVVMPCPVPTDISHVIFTSGTTGTPKAALIMQYNVCAFVELFAPACEMTTSSRVLALAGYAFDVGQSSSRHLSSDFVPTPHQRHANVDTCRRPAALLRRGREQRDRQI